MGPCASAPSPVSSTRAGAMMRTIMGMTPSIRLFAKSRRAGTPARSLDRDQIRPHPAAEGFDAEAHGGSLGDVLDGDDLVVDERLEGGAKDLLVLPGPGEI